MSHNTKTELSKALIALSKEMPLNKITVGDVAEKCGVSRHTFYYHFTDIFDLIIWTFCSFTERLSISNWREVCLAVAKCAIDNRDFAIAVYHSEFREALMDRIFAKAQDFFSNAIRHKYPNVKDAVSVARMAAYAITGAIRDWYENNLDDGYLKAIKGVEYILGSGLDNLASIAL